MYIQKEKTNKITFAMIHISQIYYSDIHNTSLNANSDVWTITGQNAIFNFTIIGWPAEEIIFSAR